jgi:5-methylcytosine-specific restriction endonuclease McrA
MTHWRAAVSDVARIVKTMPLMRLQLLRGGFRDPFLYDEQVVDGVIRLKPGVVYCLRKFSTLLGSLARNGWLREVRDNPRNAYAMGATQSLETFLFGDERVPLGKVREVLMPRQNGRCFYCGGRLKDDAHVDHFIPWALYPTNLGHNFVLADRACNTDKSDLLADVSHLGHWRARNEGGGRDLADAFASRGVVTDLAASQGIARWAYRRAGTTRAVVWVAKRETRVMARTDARGV